MTNENYPHITGAPERKRQKVNGTTLPFRLDSSAFLRQPKESIQAYEAWQLYKDYKYTNKGGLKEVAIEVKKCFGLIARWSHRWKWKERFRLYQNHKHIEEESQRRQESKLRAKKWANRTVEIRDKGFDVGAKLIERGEQLLALPIFKREIREMVKVGDQEIPTVTYLVFIESPKDGRGYVETGIKLQRLSAEMPTENLDLKFSPEELDRDLDNMTPEDLLAYAAELERLRAAEREAEVGLLNP